MSDQVEHRSSQSGVSTDRVLVPDDVEPIPSSAPASDSALFEIYERVVQTQPGTRDAEIFEKIHQWAFSDFSLPAHEFAGITKSELDSWQTRNRINLSAGHIRPDLFDLQRGYAWGQIRMAASVNRLHGTVGPPSVDEIKLAWSKRSPESSVSPFPA